MTDNDLDGFLRLQYGGDVPALVAEVRRLWAENTGLKSQLVAADAALGVYRPGSTFVFADHSDLRWQVTADNVTITHGPVRGSPAAIVISGVAVAMPAVPLAPEPKKA